MQLCTWIQQALALTTTVAGVAASVTVFTLVSMAKSRQTVSSVRASKRFRIPGSCACSCAMAVVFFFSKCSIEMR